MSVYGLIVANFWGTSRTTDIVIVASILCVFPYMSQLYQYNTSMATYSLAHLLAAAAVITSVRATAIWIAVSSVLYIAAFSIYQGVIANSATIFLIWVLINFIYPNQGEQSTLKKMIKAAVAALSSVLLGGLVYIFIVSLMDIPFDSYQSAGDAFKISDGINLTLALTKITEGTRSFFFWPESYFPNYLKKLQLLIFLFGALLCFWLPKSYAKKLSAFILLILIVFAPRLLQLLHPGGNYHALTLTAYALVFSGAVLIIHQAGYTHLRNLSIVLSFFLISGYTLQCNWISTVNYLNTFAHYSTLTQVLSRIRSLPEKSWDGKTIAVAGSYDMPSNYPYRSATGVATEFMDVGHMQKLADLMRDDVRFIPIGSNTPGALEYAANHPVWPHPESVAVVDGIGVVVFSK